MADPRSADSPSGIFRALEEEGLVLYTVETDGTQTQPRREMVECPECHGSGKVAQYKCAICDGAGKIIKDVSIQIRDWRGICPCGYLHNLGGSVEERRRICPICGNPEGIASLTTLTRMYVRFRDEELKMRARVSKYATTENVRRGGFPLARALDLSGTVLQAVNHSIITQWSLKVQQAVDNRRQLQEDGFGRPLYSLYSWQRLEDPRLLQETMLQVFWKVRITDIEQWMSGHSGQFDMRNWRPMYQRF